MKRVLQAVKVLVSTKGNTGKALRQSVTESVFTVNNLHDTLQYCEMLAGETSLVPPKMPTISTTARAHTQRTGEW
jgi:hypothetical protein